jgi:hypothetical protein
MEYLLVIFSVTIPVFYVLFLRTEATERDLISKNENLEVSFSYDMARVIT